MGNCIFPLGQIICTYDQHSCSFTIQIHLFGANSNPNTWLDQLFHSLFKNIPINLSHALLEVRRYPGFYANRRK